MDKLLAKSEPQTTLDKHVDDCLVILEQLKYAFPKVEAMFSGRFWELLRLAIIFHDLGKGHSEFQKLLKGNSEDRISINTILKSFISLSLFRAILFIVNAIAFYKSTILEGESIKIVLSIFIGWIEMRVLFSTFDLFKSEVK